MGYPRNIRSEIYSYDYMLTILTFYKSHLENSANGLITLFRDNKSHMLGQQNIFLLFRFTSLKVILLYNLNIERLLIGSIISFLTSRIKAMDTIFFCCTPVFVSYLEKQLVYHDQCDMKFAAVKDGTHYATDMQPCTFPYTFFLHYWQGFPRFSPVLNISVLYSV